MKNKVVFALLFTFLVFTSCEKEYSCEDCGGVLITTGATYSFSGGSGSCSGAMASGVYVAGTAATSSNTVTLNVVVDSVGSYSVTTNNVNGLSYKATGFFLQPGPQQITLMASGTPATAGDYTFTTRGGGGCSFTITVLPFVDNNFSYYYEANIDGVFYREVVTTTNGNEAGYGVAGTDDVILSSDILPSTYPVMPAGKTGMTVEKGVLSNYPTRNNTEFKTFFNLGNYSYTFPPSLTNGVSITWYEENGTIWKTTNLPADQSGSRFAIVLVEEVAVSPVYTVAITFTFDCKLYDGNGNTKVLTGGRFKGVFGKL